MTENTNTTNKKEHEYAKPYQDHVPTPKKAKRNASIIHSKGFHMKYFLRSFPKILIEKITEELYIKICKPTPTKKERSRYLVVIDEMMSPNENPKPPKIKIKKGIKITWEFGLTVIPFNRKMT